MPIRSITLASVVVAASLTGCGNSPPQPVEPPGTVTPSSTTAPAATATPTATPTASPSATPSASSEAKPPEPPPPTGPVTLPALPEGTTVLHVGDSMAQALAPSLAQELRKRGITSILKTKEATYIPEWAGFKWGFSGLIQSYKPDLVIITLGGNEVGMPDPSVRARPVKQMVKTVDGAPCIWIKAPLWGPHTGVMDIIRDNCEPCRWVDTDKLIPNLERLGDKIHPTIPERKRWAKLMVRWLAHNLDPQGDKPFALKQKTSAPPADGVVPELDDRKKFGRLINIKAVDPTKKK